MYTRLNVRHVHLMHANACSLQLRLCDQSQITLWATCSECEGARVLVQEEAERSPR